MNIVITFLDVLPEYNSAKIIFLIENPEFVVYEMLFRIIFSATLLFFFSLLIFRLKIKSFSHWQIEQKITVLLLFIVALYNNPLYVIKQVRWPANDIIDAFLKGLIIGFTLFFIFALFDNLRLKNHESNFCFYFPKVLLASCLGVFNTFE
jgi:hypothetical protein